MATPNFNFSTITDSDAIDIVNAINTPVNEIDMALTTKANGAYAYIPIDDDIEYGETPTKYQKGSTIHYVRYAPNAPYGELIQSETASTGVALPSLYPTYGYHDYVQNGANYIANPYKLMIPSNNVSVSDNIITITNYDISSIQVDDLIQTNEIPYPLTSATQSVYIGIVTAVTNETITVNEWTYCGGTAFMDTNPTLYVNPVNGYYQNFSWFTIPDNVPDNFKGYQDQRNIRLNTENFRYFYGIQLAANNYSPSAMIRIGGNSSEQPLKTALQINHTAKIIEARTVNNTGDPGTWTDDYPNYIMYASGNEKHQWMVSPANRTVEVLRDYAYGWYHTGSETAIIDLAGMIVGTELHFLTTSGDLAFINSDTSNPIRFGSAAQTFSAGQNVIYSKETGWEILTVRKLFSTTNYDAVIIEGVSTGTLSVYNG